MGALLLRAHFRAVFSDRFGDERFAAWWAHAEAHGLCYSFECVVPRLLGDHGATPAAAYMVLTCIAHTADGGSFLSPAQLLRLATAWRLPVNEITFVEWSEAAALEEALHAARWTMDDAHASDLLRGAGPHQHFLTHGETQGSVLEGFVLMALDCSVGELLPLIEAYEAAVAPGRAAALASARYLGDACLRRDPGLLEELDMHVPDPEPQRLDGIAQDAVWGMACSGNEREPLSALFRTLHSLYAHRVTLKPYSYEGSLQIQVDGK